MSLTGNSLPPIPNVGIGREDDPLDPCEVNEDVVPVQSIPKTIGNIIGRDVKVDYNKDNGSKGCFARMAICVGLCSPFVSKIRINGVLQRVDMKVFPLFVLGVVDLGITRIFEGFNRILMAIIIRNPNRSHRRGRWLAG
ncbi:hypothetical protein PVK06_034897 [Gossypium arboreum]|uniref:Uncharacterized protein n=1 Tax=Gossypium arboreum TaxID=29729 RepID=A0ABR0NFH0_GOSAR|nr:hypothetical protein PVK06_034897 [Gossypium arboreum]